MVKNYGVFKCKCGNIKIAYLSNVRAGYIKDCGCCGLKRTKPNPNNKSTGLRNIYPAGNSYKIIINHDCVTTPKIKCQYLYECVEIRDYLKNMSNSEFIEFCNKAYDVNITVINLSQFIDTVNYFLNK